MQHCSLKFRNIININKLSESFSEVYNQDENEALRVEPDSDCRSWTCWPDTPQKPGDGWPTVHPSKMHWLSLNKIVNPAFPNTSILSLSWFRWKICFWVRYLRPELRTQSSHYRSRSHFSFCGALTTNNHTYIQYITYNSVFSLPSSFFVFSWALI